MTTARDWISTLWSVSYKGVPFFFERDDEEGGRGIVIHKFPNRDTPFNEDLGEDPRFYAGSAYVHGDDADAQTARLIATFASRGAGQLVVPLLGPVQVRCLTFKRISEKDKQGYVAFDVKFVREGAATALISVPLASQQAYDAADSLADQAVAAFASMVTIADQPEWVAAAASDEVATAAAAIDTVRTSYPVDPVVSSTVRNALSTIVADAPALLAPDGADADDIASFATAVGLPTTPDDGETAVAQALVTTTRTLASGMDPAVAQDAMTTLATMSVVELSPTYLSASTATAAANQAGVAQLVRLAALTAWADALVARTYSDRPQGVTARAEAAERFGLELENCQGQDFAALYLSIVKLQGSVVAYLTQLITTLAPVIGITAVTIMPSLYWAWRLYQDPTRAVDLTLRNQVRHPSFMPREFTALAPGYDAPGIATAWPAPPL